MGALKKLGESIGDLAELKVETFAGLVTGKVTTAKTDKDAVVDWDKIFSQAKESGDVELIALTVIKIDGDTRLFFSNSSTPALLNAHHEAVEAALMYRSGIVEAFADAINLI